MTQTSTLANVQASLVNHEGAPAYNRSLRERVVQLLTVGVFGDTFYATKRQLDEQWQETIIGARDTDPEFLAKAVVYGRTKGLIKDQNVKALALLAAGRGKTREAFEAAFDRVVLLPDDLRKFSTFLISGQIPGKRGLGGYAAKAVARWLANISEYHALKYGSKRSKGIVLRDLIRMTHPRPATAAVAERLDWLVRRGNALGSDPALNPQIRAFEALKRATTEYEAATLIQDGRLPYEVVAPAMKRMTLRIWEELLRQAPYMNLLRMLAAFTRHGVFADEKSVAVAVEKLTSPQAVERSKVLPFRFFDAWKKYSSGAGNEFDSLFDDELPVHAGNWEPDSRIADALREALNLSFACMPSFGSRTVAIGSDVSGSMSSRVSQKGTARYIDICGILSGALLRRIENRAVLLPFDGWVHPDHGLSKRDDIMSVTQRLAGYCGGSTAVGAPIQYLRERKVRVDAFIGITDNVDWAYGQSDYDCSGSFLDQWRQYKREVNQDAQAFLVTIAPYKAAVAPFGEPGVHFIYGWSDSVVKYIPLMLEGGASQVREISRMQLAAREDRQTQAPLEVPGQAVSDAQMGDES